MAVDSQERVGNWVVKVRRIAQDRTGLIVLIGLSCLLQIHIVMAGIAPAVDQFSAVGPRIISGTPGVPAFQNRLLWPAVQHLLEMVGLPRNYAFGAVVASLIVVLNIIWIYGIRRLDPVKGGFLYILVSFFWIGVLDFERFKIWDVAEVAIFSVLALTIAGEIGAEVLLPLFVVATLTRESSAFIGLWLLIAGRPILGIGLIGVAATYTFVARKVLLRVEANATGGTAFTLAGFFEPLRTYPLKAAFLLFVVGSLAAIALTLRGRDWRLPVFLLLMGTATLCFGLWNETRVWLPLTPLAALLVLRTLQDAPIERAKSSDLSDPKATKKFDRRVVSNGRT